MNREEYEKSPKQCVVCKKALTWKQRFGKYCSHSCAATVNNKGVRRHGKPEGTCKGCGKPTRNPKYCTNACQREHEYRKSKKKVLEIESLNGHGVRFAKRLMKDLKGHECQICANKEWMGKPIPLVLDHIDGNSENNDIKNLRLVCGNCDMQLPTYKNKNKGSGRHWRRQRYRQGKSY